MNPQLFDQFVSAVREIHVLESIERLLDWDQEVMMPPRGTDFRAEQLARIAALAHQKLTSDEFGRLLQQVERDGVEDDSAAETIVREMHRLRGRAVRLPGSLVEELARTSALAKSAWAGARRESNFALFAPMLEKMLDLKRRQAELLGWQEEPYDALLDEYEPGARASQIAAIFDRVRAELIPLLDAIKSAPRRPDRSILTRNFPRDAQERFNRLIAQQVGFDFQAGRMDVSTHPFSTGISPLDVRFTTRYNEHALNESLFGTLHETGHALYEQGLDPRFVATPAASAVSLGIHESQSRMWENFVGRSHPFWEHFFVPLQQHFPALADVSLDDWYFAINTVEPSFIRVEADEVTYGLHIILRFGLERDLIAGRLAAADLPAAWNDGFKSLLGLSPPDDARGCIQDIHWSSGYFGYFPTYALGNLYAAQFFETARRELGDLDAEFRAGRFGGLLDWLREKIHRHGMRYRAGELVQTVTGQPLSHEPFAAYLRGKFAPLYGIT